MPTLRETNIILESELEFKPYNTEPMAQSNEPTIEIMNVVITTFEGRKFYGHTIDKFGGDTGNALPEMKYHTSWDWLMPVGKKISALLSEMLKQRPPHTACNGDLIEVDIHCAISEYDITKAHYHMYQFIIWYNQQKQKDEQA